MKELTISIPVYNDENSIIQLIEDIEKIKSELPSYLIFIIDDGSSDRSWDILISLKKKYPKIILHRHDKNLGFAYTISEIVKIPKTEWVLFLSGDNQFPASNIVEFWKSKHDFDFILGHRIIRHDNLYRKFNSLIYNKLIELFSGYKLKDVNSVFLCKTILFKNESFISKSAFIHAEIILNALKNNAKISVIKIRHQNRKHGSGSGGKLKTIIPVIQDFIRYFLKYQR